MKQLETIVGGCAKRSVGVQTGIKADGSPALQTVTKKYILEGDLFRLIVKSQLPTAVEFERWVFEEVLPSIRQHGAYMTPATMDKALADPTFLLELVEHLHAAQAELTTAKPKVAYFDALVDRNMLTNLRDTAKELGLKQKVFLRWLTAHKFIYKDARGANKPYAEHTPELFVLKEVTNLNNPNAWAGTQTLITPKGRETFRLLLCDDLISEIENPSSVA